MMLKCGFAQADITPVPEEIYLEGYGHRVTPAEWVNDPLYCKVCAFQSGEERFVIVSFDICGFCEELVRRLKWYISITCSLPEERVAICATHTHAGPACGLLGDLPINYLYWNMVGEKAGLAAAEAFQNAKPGQFAFALGGELTSSFNRRGASFIDRSVRAGAFYGEDGTLLGVLATAACHAVIHTDMGISADYLGSFYKLAAQRWPGVPALFLQGRGADIDPYFEQNLSFNEKCDQLGGELASAVFAAVEAAGRPGGEQTFQTALDWVEVPMSYPAEDVLRKQHDSFMEQARSASTMQEKRYPMREVDWHRVALESLKAGKSPNLKVPIQALLLPGTAAFVFLPFELLTNTGNAVEQMLRQRGYSAGQCFVLGYSNGTYGYLAPEQEFDDGGYEISGASHWYGGHIPECSRQSEGTVLKAVSELLERLD